MKLMQTDISVPKCCFGVLSVVPVGLCTTYYGMRGFALSASFLWMVSILCFDVFGNGLAKKITVEASTAKSKETATAQPVRPMEPAVNMVHYVHVPQTNSGQNRGSAYDEIAAMDPSGELRRDVDALLPGEDEGTKAVAAYDLMNDGMGYHDR